LAFQPPTNTIAAEGAELTPVFREGGIEGEGRRDANLRAELAAELERRLGQDSGNSGKRASGSPKTCGPDWTTSG
jgi:hypothetical protein